MAKKKTKNYYACIVFKNREGLHMTLRYFPNKTGEEKAALIKTIGSVLAEPLDKGEFKKFRAKFEIESWFGPQHTVRVLEPKPDHEWPHWLLLLLAELPKGSDKYKFVPHVTSKSDTLDVKAVAVALMTKQTEVCRWGLQ